MTNIAILPQQPSIWWVFLLQGFAGIILGLMLVTQPGATILALTTFLGFYWLITGLLALVQVFVDSLRLEYPAARPAALGKGALFVQGLPSDAGTGDL
jgi:uncharacterized membrane protein HdeD (DUF308 family)